jgi:hypothetical protein
MYHMDVTVAGDGAVERLSAEDACPADHLRERDVELVGEVRTVSQPGHDDCGRVNVELR